MMAWPYDPRCAILPAVNRSSRSPRPLALAAVFVVAPLWMTACGPAQTPKSSSLAEKAAKAEAAESTPEGAKTPAATAGAVKTSTADPAAAPPPPALLKPGSGDKSVTLRLALPDDTTYQVTTVGMIQYPGMPTPTGFARQEKIQTEECQGAGAERRCTLVHSTDKFEAEPPYGRFITADEAPSRDTTIRYPIGADGKRKGPSTLDAPPEVADTDEVKALADVDIFYCIHFPEVPVRVGAAWQTTCTIRNDGRMSAREATWELTSIDESNEDGHTRVELRVVGSTSTKNERGESQGTFGGTLFFLADIGEPHLLREEISTTVAQDGGVRTKARLNYQFAKVKGDAIVRTDGEPFPEAPAMPDAASAKTEAKADAEAEAKAVEAAEAAGIESP